ncbi:MAG: NAD(P)-dependent oxidoreductase [Clostridia bacterium]|nr:NAD(P)-dependent oxidoreductase [Clostridia bacterium]
MKNVIITGCNGFIGQKLTEYLLAKDITVIGMDIVKSKNNYNNFIFFELDFKQDFVRSLEKYKIDVVYHLAWCGVSTIDKNNPDKQFVNISLTYKVLELANFLKIKKIVIPGSMSEFSRYNSPVTGYEADSPADLYAATKVAIRKISYQYCLSNDLDLNWMLITSVYGPGRSDSNLIVSCINKILNNEVVETTKLEQKWDYIYIDDLINAFYLIGLKGKKNKIYPVGSNSVFALHDYVKIIFELMDYRNYDGIGKLPYKNNYIDNSIPNVNILIEDTGFKPKCSFKFGINKVIEELRGKASD